MASADALAFTYIPHDLERSNRHESEHRSTNLKRSPRRLAISTQALARAVRSCPTSPTKPDVEPQNDGNPGKVINRVDFAETEPKVTPRKNAQAESSAASAEPTRNLSTAAGANDIHVVISRQRWDVCSTIPTKRARALHDVDGPGTSDFPCKKRRLRHQLITSRLSQPFSLPATHILSRESDDDDSPCITRFLKAAAIGAKRAGHESAMVRKAAILNSVRLRARQAAIARGHAELAVLAARNTFLNHGHQVVTAPTVATIGTRFPVSEGMPGHQRLPAGWRPHTTIGPGQAAIVATAPASSGLESATGAHPCLGSGREHVTATLRSSEHSTSATPIVATTTALHTTPETSQLGSQDDCEDGEDEYGMAFPTSDLDPRYADLSDDDMDDVYADFSAIFGARSSSQERGDASPDRIGSPDRPEHFYEEYLDELDGIPWMS